MVYMFGYGSLICKRSRERTGSSGEAIPVTVKGLSRGWNIVKPKPEYPLTAVGVIRARDGNCNGVLFEVSESELPKFDEREKSYDRTLIKPSQITTLNDGVIDQSNIWVYTTRTPDRPTKECPIPQTYVDIIITGCLEISREFAEDFIKTTSGWDGAWVDDRRNPLYKRTEVNPDVETIDSLLERFVPHAYKKRMIP